MPQKNEVLRLVFNKCFRASAIIGNVQMACERRTNSEHFDKQAVSCWANDRTGVPSQRATDKVNISDSLRLSHTIRSYGVTGPFGGCLDWDGRKRMCRLSLLTQTQWRGDPKPTEYLMFWSSFGLWRKAIFWIPLTRSGSNLGDSYRVNPLKTKCRLLYLKTQFVPRSKHFISVIKTNQFTL